MVPPRLATRRAWRGLAGVLAVASAVTVLAAANVPGAARAATALPPLHLREVADLPGLVTFAVRPGDPTLYVATQGGMVSAVRHGEVLDTPVFDATGLTDASGEQGFLGMTFSPDGSKLYIHYTDRGGNTSVDELQMTGAVADPGTRRNVLEVDDPQPNHNGGQLAFGPDGLLYLGLGDGGAQDDEGAGHAPGGNGQSLETLLGKILRIDPTPTADAAYTVPADNPFVADPDADGEIWAYGLRNPFRFSFDRDTGDLWIGDVGQNTIEEVDFAAAGPTGRDAGKGLNFGWNRLEGTDAHRGRAPADAVDPVAQHTHDDGWFSVIGGYVYRGPIKALRGTYVYTDYYKAELVGLQREGDDFAPVDLDVSSTQISSFGQGNDGALYVVSQSLGLLKLVKG